MSKRFKRKRIVLLGGLVAVLAVVFVWCTLSASPNDELSPGSTVAGQRLQAQTNSSPQTDSGGKDGATTSLSPEPPFVVAAGELRASEYQRAETLENWQYLSEESCADYALSVLETIHAQGLVLKQAGFMDLSGESWGCVFIGKNEEPFMITLIPERPFSPRSNSNKLVVSILHYLEPKELE